MLWVNGAKMVECDAVAIYSTEFRTKAVLHLTHTLSRAASTRLLMLWLWLRLWRLLHSRMRLNTPDPTHSSSCLILGPCMCRHSVAIICVMHAHLRLLRLLLVLLQTR